MLIKKFLTEVLEKHGEKFAVIDSLQNRIRYADLYRRASRLKDFILDKDPDSPIIGVSIAKSVDQVIIILGIILSGKAYLPLDPAWPKDRVDKIVKKSKLKLILRSIDQYNLSKTTVKEQPKISGDDLAYVLFTSGSTGEPKGVAIEHCGVTNSIDVFNRQFNVSDKDSILGLASMTFDLSVYDIFGMLSVGGTLVLPREEDKLEPRKWLDNIQKYNATIWNSAPAVAHMLVDYVENTYPDGFLMPSVRLIIMGGDWIPLTLPDRLRAIFPNAELVSVGGSTETSIWGCFYKIGEVDPQWKSIPYGKAISGQTMQILDETLQPCVLNQVGEIYFGGVGLARGYWNDKKITKQSFINHPITGTRLYRSGDMGKVLADGNVEFICRKDSQVQINGYRVEPAEVQKAISSYPGVKDSIVVPIETDNRSKKLVAVIISNHPIQKEQLIQFLKSKLPLYMIPTSYQLLETFPLSANGKIDRKALAETYSLLSQENLVLKAPTNDIEKRIHDIWASIFNFPQINVESDFFTSGGTSILAVQLITKVNNEFGVRLPISSLFEHNTIRKLAGLIKSNTQMAEKSAVVVLNDLESHKAPLFIIHPIGGFVFCYKNLSSLISRKVYGLEFDDGYRIESSETLSPIAFLEELASLYADKIMNAHPSDTYLLCGWSSGGTIAYAIAQELNRRGKKIKFLGIIDTTNPNNYRGSKDNRKVNELAVEYYLGQLNKYLKVPLEIKNLKLPENELTVQSIDKIINHINGSINFNLNLKENILAAEIKQIAYIFTRVLNLVVNYEVSGQVEKIHFFKASASKSDIHEAWIPHSKEILVSNIIPGNHLDIVEIPNVQVLAASINASLEGQT